MPFLFEKLIVYQKALDLAEKIHALTKSFPSGTYHLQDQLNRASVSVPANIAEGNGRYHPKERRNFFLIARASSMECIPLLELCKRRNLVKAGYHKTLKADADEICKMITGMVKGLRLPK